LSSKCPIPNNGNREDQDDTYQGEDEDGSEMLWFYRIMALGFVSGFGAVCGSLVINKSWEGCLVPIPGRDEG